MIGAEASFSSTASGTLASHILRWISFGAGYDGDRFSCVIHTANATARTAPLG